jgi:release factor glutamine methyltransferase
MNIQAWLVEYVNVLQVANISTARLDCLVLLSDELGKDKAWLLSHSEYELQGSEIQNLNTKIAQRVLHIPLAYIRGRVEFYGREFSVDAHTLIPRPETETMIEMLKERVASLELRVSIADIGTGSGALAITAKLELPQATVLATDIDPSCLKVAKQNAEILGADITFLEGNLLQPISNLKSQISNLILLCNLPYVPDDFHINRAATHEPDVALFGGKDGLRLYRTLFEQTQTMRVTPRYILTESLPPQHAELSSIATEAGYSPEATDDFIQVFHYRTN